MKRGRRKDEMEDERVAQAHLRCVACPELMHMRALAAGEGLYRRGDEVEEKLCIVKVDSRRAGVNGRRTGCCLGTGGV